MYKVFLKFPDALRPAFPRLKEKLEDPDPGLWLVLSLLSTAARLSVPCFLLCVIVYCRACGFSTDGKSQEDISWVT